MKKHYTYIMIGAFFGVFLSCGLHGVQGINELWFKSGILDKGTSISMVRSTIKNYNKASAAIYATVGLRDELDVIPATPLLKRKIFQDINKLNSDGLILIFDRDSDELEEVSFINSKNAVAVTREVWVVGLQNQNRKPVFNYKASAVRVRYNLRFTGGSWVVYSVEVFHQDETLPKMNLKSAL